MRKHQHRLSVFEDSQESISSRMEHFEDSRKADENMFMVLRSLPENIEKLCRRVNDLGSQLESLRATFGELEFRVEEQAIAFKGLVKSKREVTPKVKNGKTKSKAISKPKSHEESDNPNDSSDSSRSEEERKPPRGSSKNNR